MDIIRRAFQKLTRRGLGHRAPDGVVRVYRVSAAGSVRAVAGAPIGLAPSAGSRRGTVLIIVLGTLALIAVIAVTYAVVGRADRRASAAFVGSVQREEMPALVRDYIANIVGRDAVATYRDGGGILRREAFDYPFTDPMMRSIPAGQTGVTNMQPVASSYRSMVRFSPEGTFSDEITTDPTLAQIQSLGSLGTPYAILVPSDPWLASTQATNLRLDDDVPDDGYPQYNMRDWGNITNVSPDGRFVNLWNLRNNFAVPSGFDIVPNPNAANFKQGNQISSRLTLNGPGGQPFTATVPQIRDDGTIASPNVPAHWTDRQRGAFRPATGIPTIGWSQAEHPSYQWADADGDGFYDARWFEFIDLTQGVDDPRAIFPTDPAYRWFAAVRVVDLSAAVNVNTATDFLAPPDAAAANYDAPGGTPADVDLRRLLSGEDTRELAGGIGYDGLRPPRCPTTPNAVNAASAQYTGAILQQGLPPVESAEWIGEAAYNNIRYFLEYGLVAPPQIRLEVPAFPNFITYINRQHGATVLASDLLRPQTVAARRTLYDTITGQGADLSVSLFGIDTEAELLHFRGANDPNFNSTLELVADGRLGAAPELTRHGPFRGSRDSLIEIAQRDRSDEGGGLVAPGTLEPESPDGIADLDAMTQMLVDLRQYATTLSASRPIRNTVLSTASPLPPIGANDLPLDLGAGTLSQNSLFSIYADALLPFSGFLETWLAPADPTGAQYRTLSYGHAGSELAIRHAAHMAVNMADAMDSNSEISVATLLVDENVRDDLNADYDPPPPPGQQPTGTVYVKPMGASGTGRDNPWAAWVDGGQLDLGADRLADTGDGSVVLSPAVNVYGLEAQPFLTEVAGFVLYTDAPAGAGGDTELPIEPITINGAINENNADLAFQAVAFQVTNPFGSPINLSGVSGSREFKYYIEFGGRFYRFPDLDPAVAPGSWSGTLGSNETRVFYVPARPRQDVQTRWDLINAGPGPNLADFLNSMMAVGSSAASGQRGPPPVQLTEFDPLNGGNINFAAGGGDPGAFVNRLDAGPGRDITQARLWRTHLATGSTSVGTPAETYTQNSRENDVLADRLRGSDASSRNSTLDLQIDLTDDEVTDALALTFDTGFSVMLWGTITRPSDSDTPGVLSQQDIVWLPAYCLETKAPTATLNTERDEGVNRNALDLNDFTATSGLELATTFSLLVSGATGAPVIDTLATQASLKTNNPLGSNRQGQSWSDLRAELYQGLGDTSIPGVRALRPFDMLLARGIGASLEVDASLNVNSNLTGWTTVGEATALALDYDVGFQGTNLMWSPGRPATSPQGPGSLDRGHLVLDQFVPFMDITPSAAPTFDPAQDYAFGDGMPLAMGIVQSFRSLGNQYGTERRGTPGLININTAPLVVLRTLPMLSPSHGADPSTFATTPPTGWWGDPTGQGLDSDAASMLEAYRDGVTRFPRGDSQGNAPVPPNDIIDFEIGRRLRSNIIAIREIPGFRSLGEVLAARDGLTRSGGDPLRAGPHDIDRLGLDNTPLNMIGFDPAVITGGGSPIDSLTDELDERFALVNSIANSVSVRSDTYAVWFVLHGYREGDCTGLAQNDPLIPGVSRRFLMILDRSNVMTAGDKPAILLFKEVPYSPTSAGDGSAI